MTHRPSRVYTCLTDPVLIAGVEPLLLAMNVNLGLGMLIIFKSVWVVAGMFVLHLILRSLCKKDPFTREIYMAFRLQADRYEPWPEPNPKRGKRPLKFGRGTP